MTTNPPGHLDRRRAPQTEPQAATCDGCGHPLNPVEAQRWTVCLDCTKARQEALFSGRCVCGARQVPGELCRVGSRSWIPCRRCFGTIRQIT